MENLKTNCTKQQMRVAIVGDGGCGKTTLVSAIAKIYSNDEKAKRLRNKEVQFETENRQYVLEECSDLAYKIPSVLEKSDCAILIVDGLTGVTAHTYEYLSELQNAGIANVVVFINKCDEIDDKVLLDLTEIEIEENLQKYGYPKNKTTIIQGSARVALLNGGKKTKLGLNSIAKLISCLNNFDLNLKKGKPVKDVEKSQLESSHSINKKLEYSKSSPEKRKSEKKLDDLKKFNKNKSTKILIFSMLCGLAGTGINYFIGGQLLNHLRMEELAMFIYGIGGVITAVVAAFVTNMILSDKEKVNIEGCIFTDYNAYISRYSKRGIVILAASVVALVVDVAVSAFSIYNLAIMSASSLIVVLALCLPLFAGFGLWGASMWLVNDDREQYFVCERCDIISKNYEVLEVRNEKNGTRRQTELSGYKPSSENTLGYLKDDKGNEYRIYEKEKGHFVYNEVEYSWASCDQTCKCKKCGHVQVRHVSQTTRKRILN